MQRTDIVSSAVIAAAGASSIASLLAYFAGLVAFRDGVRFLLIPGLATIAAVTAWSLCSGRREFAARIGSGLFAGSIATFAYDLCRVPIAHGGVPVFKAISYFGTVLLDVPQPTFASELAGWAYHVSNGLGFALMYVALVPRPRLWSAVLWGLFLEAAMLVTPYAEVFGYKRGQQFLAISIGGHVMYGLGLWAGLRVWKKWIEAPPSEPRMLRAPTLAAVGFFVPLLGIGGIAADFHRLHAEKLSASPPPYIGPHLYTTWDALEVDRVAAMWVLVRYVDPDAQFQFISPFTTSRWGTPFDLPEAEARRTGSQATTEVLLAQAGRAGDPVLARLAAVAHHFEIMPWAPPSTDDERGLGVELEARARACQPARIVCVQELFAFLDTWYAESSR